MAITRGMKPEAPEDWGTIGVWSWGVSRIIDYMETEPGWHLGYLAPEDEKLARDTILAGAR